VIDVADRRSARSGSALATGASAAAILSLVVAVGAWLWPNAPSTESGRGPSAPATRDSPERLDLSGTWVGQLTGSTVPLRYQLVLTQQAARVSGTARGDGPNPLDGSAMYVVFELAGQVDHRTLTFEQLSVLESDPAGAGNWCLIGATLTYSSVPQPGALAGSWHALSGSGNPACDPQHGQLRLQRR
jgi:hypothetical protein